MLQSGDMGERTAIDQIEVIAGSSIMLGVCFAGLTITKQGFNISDGVRGAACS